MDLSKKRVFVSDIHMGDERSATATRPYGWLSSGEAQALAEFVSSPTVQDADELIIVGDLVDLWVCPTDVRPPTPKEVFDAPQNVPLVKALRDFAKKPSKSLYYIPGNHDMKVEVAAALELAPETKFRPFFDDGPIHATHGHEFCLFNGRDPAGRAFPLGYYITRCTATAERDGGHQPKLDLWTVFHGAAEVIAMLTGPTTLAQAVLDLVCRRTGVAPDANIVMPDGSTENLRDVRNHFANLVGDWNAHRSTGAADAISCEWDPWGHMRLGSRINIMGHSHHRMMVRGDAYGLYINLGCWTNGSPNFAVTRPGDNANEIVVELNKWTNGHVGWEVDPVTFAVTP